MAAMGLAANDPAEVWLGSTSPVRQAAAFCAEATSRFDVDRTFIDDRPSHQRGGDFDVARAGWIGDYSDPQNFLFLFESGNGKFD
jgi:oligopeptide transport system substrate-binding protein